MTLAPGRVVVYNGVYSDFEIVTAGFTNGGEKPFQWPLIFTVHSNRIEIHIAKRFILPFTLVRVNGVPYKI